MAEVLPFLMFLALFAALLAGYGVAATLAGVAIIFACIGYVTGTFNLNDLGFLPSRLFGIMTNQTLIAVPLFIFMGVTLERSKIADTLLTGLSTMLGGVRGGVAIAVIFVGMLMAASTGIVGATVVTMGLLSLPVMLKQRYDPGLATGTIVATGTLGQIIPPSIALVLLGDVLSGAYQQAQLKSGVFAPDTVSVGDLFAGSLIPGLLLVVCYMIYVAIRARINPEVAPKNPDSTAEVDWLSVAQGLAPPVLLIVAVLGSILAGYATPTEAAGVGAAGALLLSILYRALTWEVLKEILERTLTTTSMVFFILIGASVFSLVFRGLGGDDVVHSLLQAMPGGAMGALAIVMIVIFLLGFVLDFIEITYVVIPIVGPILLAMGIDPVWLGVLIAINLQTSFLTPPFGFALFYLRGVAPTSVTTIDIYRGAVPFVLLQLLVLLAIAGMPQLATWLPGLR